MAEYFSEATDPMIVCPCGCGKSLSEPFLAHMDRLREACGFPLVVNSGFRCPDYNEKISHTGRTGPHTIGAVDFAVCFEHAFTLVSVAFDQGWTGIGINQRGDAAKRFVHLDRLSPVDHPRPRIWTY